MRTRKPIRRIPAVVGPAGVAKPLARRAATPPAPRPQRPDLTQVDTPKTAFVDYSRHLTPEGGILFVYKDLDVRWRHTLRRIFVWSVLTSIEYRLIAQLHPTTGGWLLLIALAVASWLLVRKPIEIMRSIEVRPDCMIVNGTDIFWLEQMGDNWPAFELKNDDPDSLVLGGIYGTRFIEYATSHRVDGADRTPELLAMHLKEAMEQLWGRMELVFDRPD